jgi:hypothetical protein
MEMSLSKKSRKPIFDKKDKPLEPAMYQSTPNFFRDTSHLRAKPVDHRSRIIYDQKSTMPVRVHSVAKTNKPATVTVCPPNRPQSMVGRPMPQPFHQQPYIIYDRASSPMVRSSYPMQNLQSHVIVRPMNQS